MQSHKIAAGLALFLLAEAVAASTTINANPWAFFANRRGRAIDLHSGEHCVDVSTYKPVDFKDVEVTICDTTFEKQCQDKIDQVCLEVTEMNCDVVAYADCKLGMEAVSYVGPDMQKDNFGLVDCEESTEVVQHTKTKPECKDVTRQNCITKWEIDSNGNKVWAGNEDCEDVTWQECKLVETTVDFTVPKVDCVETSSIPYMKYVNVTKTQMLNKMTCEVKSAQSCKPAVSTKCATVEYRECAEVPIQQCEDRTISKPVQERQHKQKCILTDGSVPRQGPVVDPGDTEAAQTTASPLAIGSDVLVPVSSSNAIEREGRNLAVPSRHMTPPAELAF